MKKLILLAVAILTMVSTAVARDTDGRIQIGAGLLYENGLELTIGYEKETRHHNAWEFFGNVYLKWDKCVDCGHVCPDSFWKNYRTWSVGAAYKPCVYRGRNNHGNLRLGGTVGSDLHEVIGGIHAGYEHSYVMRGGWQFFWQVKTEFVINGEDWLKTGIGIGVKF